MAKWLKVEKVCAAAVAPAVGLACALSLSLLAPPAGASRRPQNNQNKPKVADDEPTPKEKGNNSPLPNATPRPPRKLYEVIFVTSVPEVSVFVKGRGMDMIPLGKSTSEGILKTHLAAGRHQIIASRQGHQIINQQIEVQPRANRFNLTVTAVDSTPKQPEPEPVVEQPPAQPPPPTKTPEEEAAENAVKVKQIIANFIDPKRADEVPSSDWEFVLAQTGAALARDPANTSLQAQALLAQGQLAFLKSDLPTAVKFFEKAVLIETNFLPALYGLGNAYLRSALYADAFKTYQRASAADAKFAPAYRGMRDALVKLNRLKEAKQYDELYRSHGGAATPDDRVSAAVVLMKDERWPEALKELEEAAKTRNTAEVHVLIGDCYKKMKRPHKVLESYRRAVETDDNSALAHFKYGEAMYELREYEVASKELRRALELDPAPGAVINRKRARNMADDADKQVKKRN